MPVQTVTGPIQPEQLGHCQMHEHLIVRKGPATEIHPDLLISDEQLSAQELISFAQAGGRSLVDCQPGRAGRDAQALMRISQQSGVEIVAPTGYHLPMFYAAETSPYAMDGAALLEWFSSELAQGMIDGDVSTGIRAGVVKAAIASDGVDDTFRKPLTAAAQAAASAGVPLVLHTERGIGALDALRICEQAGLPPSKVLVCHADRQADDFAPHEQIARAGAMLEYDTIARYKYHDDASECRLILHMLERGYEAQLLLSLDTTRARLAAYGSQIGLSRLLSDFLPLLSRSGVNPQVIHQLTVRNPQRVFS